MVKFYMLIFLFIVGCVPQDNISRPKNKKTDPPSSSYELLFSDEFNYTGLPDPEKWVFDRGTGPNGWGNWELQYYTDRDPRNAYVEDGVLKIIARRGAVQNDPYNNYQHFFTSAKISTTCGFKYGRFDIRARVSSGFGTWPAIWMLPFYRMKEAWPFSGEIDILEHVGREPDEVFFTMHSGAFNHLQNNQLGRHVVGDGDWEDKFYDYSFEWKKDSMEWFVNGESVHFIQRQPHWGFFEWPFDRSFSVIINLAIGGGFGFIPGTPREYNMPRLNQEIFPKTFEIDYIRVYGDRGNMNCMKN
jgi:beta-glucanase (GH16 family)